MDYLTYEEYTSLGGILDVTAFNRNIDRACAAVDRETFNRVSAMAEVPHRVKALCRDLTEYYAANASVSEKGVASWTQTAGSVSESVSYASKNFDETQAEIYNLVEEYLSGITDDNGTFLLYWGAGR